jgi:hypothetical protein
MRKRSEKRSGPSEGHQWCGADLSGRGNLGVVSPVFGSCDPSGRVRAKIASAVAMGGVDVSRVAK